MILKNKYTIEELAQIANKERVEIRIDISPQETTIDIEPYDNTRYWSYHPYWVSPTITTPNPTWDYTKVTCNGETNGSVTTATSETNIKIENINESI